MAIEYPDVMNDILDARQRLESGVVQYLAELPREPAPAGSTLPVALVMQNVMDAPIRATVHIELPDPGRKQRRLPQPPFRVFQPEIHLTLAPGEVARLTLPMFIDAQVSPGEYPFALKVQSQATEEGLRARPEHGENRVGDFKIRRPQGLGIAQISSWGYQAQRSATQKLQLVVAAPGEIDPNPALKPQFESLWTSKDWELIPAARRETNDRRIHVLPELTPESLFVPFMRESQVLMGDSGVQLHVGEGIFLAKILTYTVIYMTHNGEWFDCLFVPIYAYAQATEQPTDDAVWLLTELCYTHVLELAVALSFGLVEDALGREPWTPSEQRAVREYIVQCLSGGQTLPAEFLYLPLMLGGIGVANEVTFAGEDGGESLRLLNKAKGERKDLFAEPDLKDLNDVFDRLIARQARGRART